jgi:hypothetical protein
MIPRGSSMHSPHPHFGFFPALPLGNDIELGDWVIGPPPTRIKWHSKRFRELAKKLLKSYASNKSGERFRDGALLWRKGTGFDGTAPSRKEFLAIQAAVRFAALDSNDPIDESDPNTGHHLVTSENAALHVQPIDLEHGYVTHVREGALKQGLTGGWKIGQRTPPLADATLPITLGSVRASRKLANAVFQAHIAPATEMLRRLCIAVEWHSVALSNPVAVTTQQRLIALKTGFEALLGESDSSREAARKLRELFEATAAPHLGLLPSPNVLWSPKEKKNLVRQYVTKKGKTKEDVRSELEDWFMTLAEARNAIIHEGRVKVVEYSAPPERPLSRYAGRLFWKGERILREAIKATLGVEILLCGPLREQAAFEPIFEAFRAQAQAQAPAEQSAASAHASNAPTDTNAPARDRDQLLNELNCDSANQVKIGWSSGGASATLEAAVEMAKNASWVAKARGKEIRITEEEREVLEQAGAELELRQHLTPCD